MKSFYQDRRVIQEITSTDLITDNDADLSFQSFLLNSTTTERFITLNFNTILNYVIVSYGVGSNRKYLKVDKNVSSITKNMKSNEDNNGNLPFGVSLPLNLIYLPPTQIHLVRSISLVSPSSGGWSAIQKFQLHKVFPNLREIDFKTSGNTTISDIEFIQMAPNLKIIKSDIGSITSKFSLSAVKVINTTANVINLIQNMPATLEMISVANSNNSAIVDLSDIYTGHIKSFTITTANAQVGCNLNYSGGATFPSIISNDDSDFSLGYIFDYNGSPINAGNLKGDVLSQFLIDFANQVTSVTTPTAQRRMRFRNMSPNTSYEDLSQPLFKTYATALAHITNTLGITVQFT